MSFGSFGEPAYSGQCGDLSNPKRCKYFLKILPLTCKQLCPIVIQFFVFSLVASLNTRDQWIQWPFPELSHRSSDLLPFLKCLLTSGGSSPFCGRDNAPHSHSMIAWYCGFTLLQLTVLSSVLPHTGTMYNKMDFTNSTVTSRGQYSGQLQFRSSAKPISIVSCGM